MTSEFASKEYSRQLADMFPNAEYWIIKNVVIVNPETWGIAHKSEVYGEDKVKGYAYPAITIQMCLDVLPTNVHGYKQKDGYACYNSTSRISKRRQFKDKSLPNALCKMILWLKENKLIAPQASQRCSNGDRELTRDDGQ